MSIVRPARRLIVLLFSLTLVATVGFALWGVRVAPQDVLAPDHHPHAVTPLAWANSLIRYTHDDGNVSEGARVECKDAVATVLYFGGNGYTLDRLGERTHPSFESLPVNVVIYDRRGYGRTQGIADIRRLEKDAVELYRHTVASEKVPVIIHGHSLGSFIASRLVAEVNPPWVVLEAPGTNVSDFVRAHFSHGFGRLVRVDLSPELADIDSPRWLRQGTGSVAVLKAPVDAVLPSWMADTVAAAVPNGRGRLILCPGADHNNMGPTGCFPQAYEPWLEQLRPLRNLATQRTPSMHQLPLVAVHATALAR